VVDAAGTQNSTDIGTASWKRVPANAKTTTNTVWKLYLDFVKYAVAAKGGDTAAKQLHYERDAGYAITLRTNYLARLAKLARSS